MNDKEVLATLQRWSIGESPLPAGWQVYDRESPREVNYDQRLILTPEGFVYGDPERQRTSRTAAYANVRECSWKRVLTLKGGDGPSLDLNELIERWVYTAELVFIYNNGTRGEWRIPVDFSPSPFALAEQIVADFHSFAARRQLLGPAADDIRGASGYKRESAFMTRMVRMQNRLKAVGLWSFFVITALIFSVFAIQLVVLGISIISDSLSSSANFGEAAKGVAAGLGLTALSPVFALIWPFQLLTGKAQGVYAVVVGAPLAAGIAGALVAFALSLFYYGVVYQDTAFPWRVVFLFGSAALIAIVSALPIQVLQSILKRRALMKARR